MTRNRAVLPPLRCTPSARERCKFNGKGLSCPTHALRLPALLACLGAAVARQQAPPKVVHYLVVHWAALGGACALPPRPKCPKPVRTHRRDGSASGHGQIAAPKGLGAGVACIQDLPELLRFHRTAAPPSGADGLRTTSHAAGMTRLQPASAVRRASLPMGGQEGSSKSALRWQSKTAMLHHRL